MLSSVFAQQRSITGTVTSESDGLSLPGVTVVLKGSTNIGTITDTDGKYSITVPENAKALLFTFIGMESQEVTLGTSNVVNVVMAMSSEALGEVVVTALGIEREVKALGFSAQSIGSEDLSASRETSLTGFLTAKVAGVQVSKTSGGAGGSSSVTIRGNSSISGTNQPLYVVDGIPIINLPISGTNGLWGETDTGDGIGDINPEDVESVTVLKGPNASALYGSRGANGVILITTKSGKKGKGIGVEVNSNLSMDVLNLFPTFQNKYGTGYEGTNLYGSMKEINGQFYETMPTWHGDSWGPPLDGRRTVVDPFVYPEDKNTRTLVLLPQPENNVHDFYNVGITNTNNVALSGGDEKSSARVSFGNTSIKGITPNHEVNKQSISLRATTKVTDFLSFDGKINYVHTKGSQRPTLGSNRGNVANIFSTMGRYVPLPFLKEYYETTGERGRWPGVGDNPYYVVNELRNDDYRDRFLGYVSANLKITDWLSLMGRVGADIYTEYQERKYPVGSRYPNAKGRITTSMRHLKDINADVLLTASKEVSSTISLSGSLGANVLSQRRDYTYMDARNFKAPGVYHVTNAQQYFPSSSLWEKEVQSVYGMGQVAYKNFLFLDITGRNDWSSTLGLNNQSFFYPSVAGSFVFTDAMAIDENIISFGKVRASWAQVGNDSDPYLTKSGYTSYTTAYDGQSLAAKNGQLPLFDLKNELTESWEIGADLRFFKSRLTLDATYYNSKTTNQILPTTISNASGYSSVVINAGEIQNKGVEIVLNASPVKTGSGFSWDVSANFAKNHSKVISLAPGVETYKIADNYPNDIEARPGEAFGNIIGYATRKAPDGQLIVSAGGAYEREAKTSILGNITPDWIGGLNNAISYKGMSLSFLLDFVQGGELSSSTKYQMTAKGTGKFTEEGRRPQDMDDAGNQLPYVGVLDGVVEVFQTNTAGEFVLDDKKNKILEGYETNTKAVDGQTYWANRAWGGPTDWFVLDGSYIMLREVMLSYRFQPSLLSKTPFNGLTLTLIGRNLWYIEEHMQDMGISPESAPSTDAGYAGIESFGVPTTRTYGLNVKLTF
ncbi:MAG: SusC/RagA family TonB-linked outer membrane protein [Draconibacterium sp.]|nr:SusC/RagA family TonB-linked outer membrane protein [Draconibacterium sp.]